MDVQLLVLCSILLLWFKRVVLVLLIMDIETGAVLPGFSTKLIQY